MTAVLAAEHERRVIEVTGEDRLTYLNDVTTQQFTDREPGDVVGVLVLDGKGAPLAQAWALVDTDRVLLLASPDAATHLLDVVAARTFLAQASFAAMDLPVTSVVVPGAQTNSDATTAWLRAAGLATVVDRWSVHGSVLVARHAFGVEVVGMDFEALAQVADVQAATAEKLVVAGGTPRLGVEVAQGRLPEEYGLLPTHVHLAKGCYPGQEPIAHMWMLGRPRRRLARLAVDREVDLSEVDVTAASDGIAVAFVPAATAVGEVIAGGAEVVAFVGDGRDVEGWTPAQTRRRDRDGQPGLPRRAP